MTTPPHQFSIPKLTNDNYDQWLTATSTAAQQALPTNGKLGGLGLLLPPDEYAAMNQNQPFVPATKPVAVTNAATTHEQLAYDREQLARAALSQAIYASLPPGTLMTAPGYDPTYGASFLELPALFPHVRAKHGNTTLTYYNKAKEALLPQYVMGSDIDSFIATHTAVHLSCVRTENAMNDIDKVECFIAALGGRDGPFSFTIHAWEEDAPSLRDRKFEDIQNHMGLATRIRIRQAAPSVLTTAVTGGPTANTTRGYYGAAAATNRADIANPNRACPDRDFSSSKHCPPTARHLTSGMRLSVPCRKSIHLCWPLPCQRSAGKQYSH